MAELVPIPQLERSVLFSSLRANLRGVGRHLPARLKRDYMRAQKRFEMLAREAGQNGVERPLASLPSFWRVYEEVQLLVHEVNIHLADQKWES